MLRIHYQYAVELSAHTYIALAYTNVSSHACSVTGWPQVVGVASSGRTYIAVPKIASYLQPMLSRKTLRPTDLAPRLEPHGSAYSLLLAAAASSTRSGACPHYVKLEVTPPHATTAATLPGRVPGFGVLRACDAPFKTRVLAASAVRTHIR